MQHQHILARDFCTVTFCPEESSNNVSLLPFSLQVTSGTLAWVKGLMWCLVYSLQSHLSTKRSNRSWHCVLLSKFPMPFECLFLSWRQKSQCPIWLKFQRSEYLIIASCEYLVERKRERESDKRFYCMSNYSYHPVACVPLFMLNLQIFLFSSWLVLTFSPSFSLFLSLMLLVHHFSILYLIWPFSLHHSCQLFFSLDTRAASTRRPF